MKAFLIFAALCAFALLLPNFGRAFLERIERTFARIAVSRWIVPAIAVAAFLLSVTLTLFYRLPQPRIHDEFSYLLQADTFAHGRLTNPTHPLWRYFETFHVLQQPTYASKYQPGQGLFLALGQIVWQPIVGVWLSTALAVSALFWMLRAMFNPAWALAGTILAFLNAQLLWWNWSYWGGCVPLLGGALVLGGLFRILKEPRVSSSVLMGIGCGLLAITRPFEGMLLCGASTVICLVSLYRQRNGKAFAHFLAPLICAVTPFLLFMAYYNFRVTGNAFTPAYALYEKQYSHSPLFIWQPDPVNHTEHSPRIEAYYKQEKIDADLQRTFGGYFAFLRDKFASYDRYFWHGIVLLLWIPALIQWKKPFVRSCLFLFAFVFVASNGLTFWAFPHYGALIFPLAIALALYGLAVLYAQPHTRLLGQLVFLALCALGVSMFAPRLWREQQNQWQYKRADLVAQLKRTPSKHLVLVHYGPRHNRHNEWIYNRADIDSAPVVFAPDGTPDEIKPLLEYFKGYEVLHIEPDTKEWGD